MASGKKKAAKKKVKPSRPARCAVLWGLDPSFGEAAGEKGAAVRQVLRQMGVPARTLAYERLGDSAAAAAGLVGARPALALYDGPSPDCEFGATQGKFELASCAKKNGLDAIHDTVHEMARDEARHGKALKGMLERYF